MKKLKNCNVSDWKQTNVAYRWVAAEAAVHRASAVAFQAVDLVAFRARRSCHNHLLVLVRLPRHQLSKWFNRIFTYILIFKIAKTKIDIIAVTGNRHQHATHWNWVVNRRMLTVSLINWRVKEKQCRIWHRRQSVQRHHLLVPKPVLLLKSKKSNYLN